MGDAEDRGKELAMDFSLARAGRQIETLRPVGNTGHVIADLREGCGTGLGALANYNSSGPCAGATLDGNVMGLVATPLARRLGGAYRIDDGVRASQFWSTTHLTAPLPTSTI